MVHLPGCNIGVDCLSGPFSVGTAFTPLPIFMLKINDTTKKQDDYQCKQSGVARTVLLITASE